MQQKPSNFRPSFNNIHERHRSQLSLAPAPSYSVTWQESISSGSLSQQFYCPKKDPKQSFPQPHQKQPTNLQQLNYGQIFGSFHPKNYPAYFYKNKLYVISPMAPNVYTYEKTETKAGEISLTDDRQKDADQHAQTINNIMELPVYMFEHKAWTVQKFKIRQFHTFADNFSFLHPTRHPEPIKQKSQSTENGKLVITPPKKSDRQKPALYFPNELMNMAYCKDSEVPQIMYLFGGIFQERLSYTNRIWKIDFDSMFVEMLEHKGDVPEPREGGALFYYSPSWVILHGGYNLMNCQVFSDFYVFNLENKAWSMIEVDFDSYFTPRIDFSLSYNPCSRSCFLFGGMILDHNNRECLLDDMYEFRLVEEEPAERKYSINRKFRARVEATTVMAKSCASWPDKVKAHSTFWLDRNILLLLGGELTKDEIDIQTTLQSSLQLESSQKESSPKFNHKIWIFDRRSHEWTQVLPENTGNTDPQWKGSTNACMDFRVKIAENSGQTDLITFGGFSSQDPTQVTKLTFHTKDYSEATKRHYQQKLLPDCDLCPQHKQNSKKNSFQQNSPAVFPADMIEEMIMNLMPFAFTAFGHLASLGVEKGSSKIEFYYLQKGDCQIGVEEDGYLPYTAEEIGGRIHNFSIQDAMQVQGVSDKKYKAYQTRQGSIINFCNKLKLSTIRLGNEMLWIAVTSFNEIVVYWLKSQFQTMGSQRIQFYKSYFYAIDEKTLELLPGFSSEVQKIVEDRHGLVVRTFCKERKTVKSMVKIAGLRRLKDEGERLELVPDFKRNTVLLNCDILLDRKSTFPMLLISQDSIDVNLRAYLSMYFLVRQIKILLKVQRYGPYSPAVVSKGKPQASETQAVNSQRVRSSFVNKVQQYLTKIENSKEGSSLSSYRSNKFEEVNFLFMLQKIDLKIESGELVEVELDCFGEFDCKIVEVYYWMGKRDADNVKIGHDSINWLSELGQEDLMYSNGLLIYQKGQLVKRYKHGLGMLLVNQECIGKVQKWSLDDRRNMDQFYSSLNQYNTRLLGVIEVNDKYVPNVFGTDFMNEEFLERLYERIEHVSMMYEKMYGSWKGCAVGKMMGKTEQGRQLFVEAGKTGRKKAKLSEENLQSGRQ